MDDQTKLKIHLINLFQYCMNTVSLDCIRNFCIIAHIDHGKTTLSDCLIEATKSVDRREMKSQLLDSMDLERERGITIKSHPISMHYKLNGESIHLFNLIDTPGHIDFRYEVSRSIVACEGALLLIDAAQGIQSQTISNAHLAIEQGLKIIPVINKIDLLRSDIRIIFQQIEEILSIQSNEVLLISSRTGFGISNIMHSIIDSLPCPNNTKYTRTRILIFDSIFDKYKGVICYVRIFSGSVRCGDEIIMMNQKIKTIAKEVGIFTPKMKSKRLLAAGYTGYIVTSIKNTAVIKIGDTITLYNQQAVDTLPGYEEMYPVMFNSIYPKNRTDYNKLRIGLLKLSVNDSSLVFQNEQSIALGFGYRCGFLGLLHMEIIHERLRREYDLDIISTYPSVDYQIILINNDKININNPLQLNKIQNIKYIQEPTIQAKIYFPSKCIGSVINLIIDSRGICDSTEVLDIKKLMIKCRIPLNEILINFNDKLKSFTNGYGSMHYTISDYIQSDLVVLNILINGNQIDAFSLIIHRSKACDQGKKICINLKSTLKRQLFKISIQAAIDNKIFHRENVNALRKDVTSKCYGGDVSRKRKLLEKQKAGKKRMAKTNSINIDQNIFESVLVNR